MRNTYVKMFILNILIVLAVVVCYSEGFLNLRPWDVSILRAGMSIFVGIAAAAAFVYGNHTLLAQKQERVLYVEGEISDITKAKDVLSSFHGGRFFGAIADTAANQLGRLERTMDRADKAIGLKFDAGSMAYDRYASTIQAAREAALMNCVGMANRMQLFDESEYAKLEHYRNDQIPDDIQEQHIALYERNMKQIESAVAANEKLIVALDEMSLELASSKELPEEAAGGGALLDEIQRLTDQVRLYT